MRVFRIAVLALHGVTELTVAALMWFRPTAFFTAPSADTIDLARAFGAGAGAVGLLSFLLLRWPRGDADFVGALVLMAYQLVIFVNQLRSPMAGVPPWVPPVFHGAFVLSFAAFAARAARAQNARMG